MHKHIFLRKEERNFKSHNGETKSVTENIFWGNPDIVKDVTVLRKLKFSDHQLARCKLSLNLKRERAKLMSKNHPNIIAVKEKKEEIALKIKKKNFGFT